MELLSLHSLAIIGVLVFLEGILSVDNALVLAMIARTVPAAQQKKVLTYGLVGAVVFRMLAIGIIQFLIKQTWLKIAGGAYLLFLVIKYFVAGEKEHQLKSGGTSFWSAVIQVELTDIAFAIDSILAAVALTSEYWLIVAGGIMGTVMMRMVAGLFIRLLEKFPNLETTAYLLIAIIGVKVILEGVKIDGVDFQSFSSPWAQGQWILMALVIVYGFIPKKKT